MNTDEMGIEYKDHKLRFELLRHYDRNGNPENITNNVITSSARYELTVSGHDKNKGRPFKTHEAHIEIFDTTALSLTLPVMVMDIYVQCGKVVGEFVVINESSGLDHKYNYYIYAGSVELGEPKCNNRGEGFYINFDMYLRAKEYLLIQNTEEMWQIKTDKGNFITPRFKDSNFTRVPFKVSNTFMINNTSKEFVNQSEFLSLLRGDLFTNILISDSFKVKDVHDKDILEFDNNTWSWLDYDFEE